MGDKIKLFNESDQEEQEDVEFRTNKSYAKHYDEFRKKEILGHRKRTVLSTARLSFNNLKTIFFCFSEKLAGRNRIIRF